VFTNKAILKVKSHAFGTAVHTTIDMQEIREQYKYVLR